MKNYSGQFSVGNGPTYSYISAKKSVTVSVFVEGSLQGSAILDGTNKSATLYSSTEPEGFTAVASLVIDNTTNIITLKYHVEYYSQQSAGTSYSGVISSWRGN